MDKKAGAAIGAVFVLVILGLLVFLLIYFLVIKDDGGGSLCNLQEPESCTTAQLEELLEQCELDDE